MTSSSKPASQHGTSPQPAKPGTAYTRFIPREELQGFAAWTPNALNDLGRGTGRPGQAPPPPPPPTEEQLRAQHQEQIRAARQAGYQDGYRDGLVALESFKQSFAQQMAAQIGTLLSGFDAQLDTLEQQMAQAVARSATLLARQLLRGELVARPEWVAQLAEEAVDAVLLSARHIRVHVHPEDLPLVATGAAEALQARGARLLAAPELSRGGCRIDSDLGAIDARIETRWAQAAALLGEPVPWAHDATAEADDEAAR